MDHSIYQIAMKKNWEEVDGNDTYRAIVYGGEEERVQSLTIEKYNHDPYSHGLKVFSRVSIATKYIRI